MPRTVSATIEIAAPPSAVYAVLVDLAAYREWNPQIPHATGEVAVGRRITLKMAPPVGPGTVTIHPKVIVANPGVELRLLGRIPLLFSGEHRFKLIALRGGANTQVTQSETYRGLVVPLLGRTLTAAKTGFEQHNRALKQRVERLAHELS